MTGFLQAHGYDPGPTQRPTLAGAIVGVLGTAPATAILAPSGALEAEAKILGLSTGVTIALGVLAMSLAGAAYGRLFGRAANDRRGGWLFGAAFGFLLWMGGAVMILPLLGGGRTPAGTAAMGVFLALVLWGTAIGALFPLVHKRLHGRADLTSSSHERTLGPSAAAAGRDRLKR